MHLNYETIGKRIRLLRKQQHLSQMELAEMVDVHIAGRERSKGPQSGNAR